MLSDFVRAEYATVAQNVYRFRVLQHLSQAKLAEMAGVSSAYISQIECAHLHKGVTLTALTEIAEDWAYRLAFFLFLNRVQSIWNVLGRLQLKLFTNKKSWNSVRRDTTFFYLCDIVEKIWKADEFLWRQKELSICAVTVEKKKLVLFQWADLSPANVRAKTATSRTLGLSIANLRIKFGDEQMEEFINGVADDMQQKISNGTNELVGGAIDNIAKYLPTDSEKQNFLDRIHEIKSEGIEATLNGEDYQKYLNQGAYETSVFLANHYAKEILERAKNQFSSGKTRDAIFNALNEMSRKGIEGLCSGQSLEVVKKQLANIGRDHMKKYVESQSRIWSKNIGNSIYRKIKFSGRRSRKKNKYLRAGRDIVADELAFQITDNFGEWLGGEKSFGDAVTDIATRTAKNSAVNYTKKQGAELVAEAVKELAKKAEKEIGKGLVSNGLKKLANANTLMNVAGTAYDVGKALKRLMDGEITKAEFLQIVGEKGTAAVISSYTALIGGALGGPIGAAIGGAIGSALSYFASSFIFNSLTQASREAELSRQRYEAIHAYCEYSIREMERQRLEFESKVKEFLGARQAVIDSSLDNYERALKNNDFDAMSSALNNIAEEFGGELQFKTRKEFVDFMNDKNSVFEF